MDLPDVKGLPTLVFFDRQARHVLSKSGYRPIPHTVDLLTVVADQVDEGTARPYGAPGVRRWAQQGLDEGAAAAELDRLVTAIWIKMDSNKGGFGSPAHDPRPEVLEELEAVASGRPRLRSFIDLTVRNALRGSSPRLRGAPAADMDFSAAELLRLYKRGSRAGARWREGIERLPTADPFLGIQDPYDGGIFRYAAGPGWYHPHFERRAMDNLAWVQVLRAMGRGADADRVAQYVRATFSDGALLRASQSSDPFYYRLTAAERGKVKPPAVARLYRVDVQARAARVWPERCGTLDRVPTDRWPLAHWTRNGMDERGPSALPDAFGELLLAQASCPGSRDRAAALAAVAIERWERGLPATGRLHRLAAGICAASPPDCAAALATVAGLPVDLQHAPPLRALQDRAPR